MKKKFVIVAILACLSVFANAQSIKKYTESASNFNDTIVLSNNTYPPGDMYRAYKRAGTGFRPISGIQQSVEDVIARFAKKQGKSFIILGQKRSNPPYIGGNNPRVEIIFALIPKN